MHEPQRCQIPRGLGDSSFLMPGGVCAPGPTYSACPHDSTPPLPPHALVTSALHSPVTCTHPIFPPRLRSSHALGLTIITCTRPGPDLMHSSQPSGEPCPLLLIICLSFCSDLPLCCLFPCSHLRPGFSWIPDPSGKLVLASLHTLSSCRHYLPLLHCFMHRPPAPTVLHPRCHSTSFHCLKG